MPAVLHYRFAVLYNDNFGVWSSSRYTGDISGAC